jgi:hypothetical protein
MPSPCVLVWGGTGASESSIPVNRRTVLDDIQRAASNSQQQAAGPTAEMQKPEFWSNVENQLRERSRLDRDLGSFDNALAFLSNRGATSDFRQLTASALTLAAAALLQGGQFDPFLRQEFLSSMLSHQNELQSFSSEKGTSFKDGRRLQTGEPFTIEATVENGCLDMHTVGIQSAILIKTQWAQTRGRRC